MLFHTLDFALFLPLVFLLYWFPFKNSLRLQNFFLLFASYFFYGWWDWRFLGLLGFSTVLDFFCGLQLGKCETKGSKKFWLWLSVGANLAFLGTFKYYNFFVESFADAFSFIGVQFSAPTLNLILPVGISFYTFHGLSYIFDIYSGRIAPERNLVTYSVFVSFFPLLVAGPIERATHLLPQIGRVRTFNYSKAVSGLRQILWGLFKKVVIADNCAAFANQIFDNSGDYGGSTLLLGAFFFAFQIYGDFSGYSDIALGTARLLDIDLIRNFAFPYFSRDIAEFWRRWHISLSTWFRDYVYFPLGGSKQSFLITLRNTLVIFLLSGFWHGANWTFIVWGALHACYFVPLLILGMNRNNVDVVAVGRALPSFKELASMFGTFLIVLFAWIFFRAENVTHACSYISTICSRSLFEPIEIDSFAYFIIGMIAIFMTIEWIGRASQFAIERWIDVLPQSIRWTFYLLIIGSIFLWAGKEQDFIYFQF